MSVRTRCARARVRSREILSRAPLAHFARSRRLKISFSLVDNYARRPRRNPAAQDPLLRRRVKLNFLSARAYIYIYVCVHVCVCTCVFIAGKISRYDFYRPFQNFRRTVRVRFYARFIEPRVVLRSCVCVYWWVLV